MVQTQWLEEQQIRMQGVVTVCQHIKQCCKFLWLTDDTNIMTFMTYIYMHLMQMSDAELS